MYHIIHTLGTAVSITQNRSTQVATSKINIPQEDSIKLLSEKHYNPHERRNQCRAVVLYSIIFLI